MLDFTRRLLLGTAAATTLAGRAHAQAQPTIRIGVLSDMSGPYRDISGPNCVSAARQAVQDFGTAAGFKSKEQRFKPTDQQKTTTDAYASYSQDHGTMMAAAAKASENRSAAFASGTSGRSSWLPTDPREKQRALREAQEREERKRAWEEYQQELL